MIRAVIACGGREGIYPCRQATPVGVVDTGAEARRIAARDGWTAVLTGDGVLDLCPACARRRAEARSR
jgi:hypothetical protein